MGGSAARRSARRDALCRLERLERLLPAGLPLSDGGATWEGPFEATGTFQARSISRRPSRAAGTRDQRQIRTASIPSMAPIPTRRPLHRLQLQAGQERRRRFRHRVCPVHRPRGHWSAPVVLNDDGTTATSSSLGRRSGGGSVLVMSTTAATIRQHGTSTFTRPSRWTAGPPGWQPPPHLPSFAPVTSSCYMGDYNQVVSDGSRYYWPGVTTQHGHRRRRRRFNPDVFFTTVKAKPGRGRWRSQSEK